jgi:hypothetical protein
MASKTYSRVAAAIFAIIALLQLLRAFLGWEITLNGAQLPLWASWLASLVAITVSWLGFTARA